MSTADDARAHLRAWARARPASFFDAEPRVASSMAHWLGPERFAASEASLRRFGEACASRIEESVCAEEESPPRLSGFDELGERTNEIVRHPAHDVVARSVWEAGLLRMLREPGRLGEHLAHHYLLAHSGEAGVCCSLIATYGLARMLERTSPELSARYRDRLLTDDYDQHLEAAFFLTEVQGGSDVGANTTVARPADGDTWRIHGEKWFCSNLGADLFMLSGRREGGPPGTKGLELFVVPQSIEGRPNGLRVRRLKNKIGTRALPSGEIEFDGAIAHSLGPTSLRVLFESTLNVSRLFNAVVAAGVQQRAFLEARRYARFRRAFGRTLDAHPLVRETLVELAGEAAASRAFVLAVARLFDEVDEGRLDPQVPGILANLAKYVTSARAGACAELAMQVLGGNGAIEPFSALPRLYRDMVVYAIWEGTHNVIALHVMRELAKPGVAAELRALLDERLSRVRGLDAAVALVRGALSDIERPIPEIHALRRLARIAEIARATFLLEEAGSGATDASLAAVAETHVERRIRNEAPPEPSAAYFERIDTALD